MPVLFFVGVGLNNRQPENDFPPFFSGCPILNPSHAILILAQ